MNRETEREQHIAWLSIQMPKERLIELVGGPDPVEMFGASREQVARAARHFEVTEFEVGMRVGVLLEHAQGGEKRMGEEEIKLGDRVRDKVTKFEGTVTGRCTYLHLDTRVEVTGVDGSGAPREMWFAEKQVEVVK